MTFKVNPKTNGSGILAAIPQKGTCPNECSDCFFQSGRSYLEPLDENLPNLPTLEQVDDFRIVRVNDGNDSLVKKTEVLKTTKKYPRRFYNTAIPRELSNHRKGLPFDGEKTAKELESLLEPVVVTINPAEMTDTAFYLMNPIPKNLMFVRIRTNTWNLENVVDKAIEHYTKNEVPVILTFMAYYGDSVPKGHEDNYMFRKRTLNSYSAITTDAREKIMDRHKYNMFVYSCGKIEGEKGKTSCSRCGNCAREYLNTKEKLSPLKVE
ncbi:MAG: hypothetical protein PHT91_01095 [Candidatus Nanoarchaeia archaeon]|nr:hypothetical protein [Candidatus Nanoarchaeia archaeon]